MRNLRITVTHPETRRNGAPIVPSDLLAAEISFRIQGIEEFTPLADITAPETVLDQPEFENGRYDFQAVWHLADGTESNPVVLQVEVSDEPVPASPPLAGTFNVEVLLA